MSLFSHKTVPTHADTNPVENLASEVTEAFSRLESIISTNNIIPSISSVIGDHILTDMEYYGIEKEVTESFSLTNGKKDVVLSLLPTRTTEISVSYLNTNTSEEVYLTEKLPEQQFTGSEEFKVLGKILSVSHLPNNSTIKVKYSGIRNSFGNLKLKPNVLKDTNNVIEKELLAEGNKVYYVQYDHIISTETEKIFGTQQLDKSKIFLLIKKDGSYVNVDYKNVYIADDKIKFELHEELDNVYNSVVYVNNISVSDFLLAFYKEFINHSHSKTDNVPAISHNNLIDLYKNTSTILYKDVNIPNYEHPQYLNREGYNPSVTSAYENALLGDLLLASKITSSDQEYKSILKSSNSILFGDPVVGSRLFYDVNTKSINLLSGATLNGLNIDVATDKNALSINNTSHIKESDASLEVFPKNSTLKVTALTADEKSKIVSDLATIKDTLTAETVKVTLLELGNIVFQDISNTLKIAHKDPNVAAKINIELPVFAKDITTEKLRAINMEMHDNDRISIDDKTFITKKDKGFNVISEKDTQITSTGRHSGLTIGVDNLSANTYTANYLGQAASDVDTSIYTEVPHHSDIYYLKSTKQNVTYGTQTFKFGNETLSGVTSIQSLKDWQRAGIHSGKSSAYSMTLKASDSVSKNGIIIDSTKLYTIGANLDCPEGMTILESADTVSIIRPLPETKQGCGDIRYQNVNTGNLQVFGTAAIDDSLIAVENSTAGETLIGKNLQISEDAMITNLSVNGSSTFTDNAEFNSSVEINNTLTVKGAARVDGTLGIGSATIDNFLTVGGALTVKGQSVYEGDVLVSGKINTTAGFTTAGPIQADSIKTGPIEAGKITAIGGLAVEGKTSLAGITDIEGSLAVSGSGLFNGALETTSDFTANSIYVTQNVDIEGRLTVNSDTTITGKAITIGTTDSTLNLSGIIHFNTNNATFTGDMKVLGDQTVTGNISSAKDISASGVLQGTKLEISAGASIGGLLKADSGEFARKSYFTGGLDAQDTSTLNIVRIEESMVKKEYVDDLIINKSLTTGPEATVKTEMLVTADFQQTSKTAEVDFNGVVKINNDTMINGAVVVGNKDIMTTRSTSGVMISDKEIRMGMNSVLKSTKVFATKGTPKGGNLDLNAGFCFESLSQNGGTDGDTGMFATVGTGSGVDGSDIEFYIDGIRRGIIPKVSKTYADTRTPNDTLVDFHVLREAMADLKALIAAQQLGIVDKFYPIGSIYITTNGQDANDIFGFGTWVRFGQGRTLVGQSMNVADIAGGFKPPADFDLKTIGAYYGDFTHKLTISEIPMHTHRYTSDDNAAGAGGTTSRKMGRDFSQRSSAGTAVEWFTSKEFPDESGGDQPHNNIQPSVVVAMWQRIK